MPAIFPEVSVAANTTNSNIVNGSAFEYARGRQLLSAGVSAAAAGVLTTITSGADVILEESACPILTRFPIVPDEMYFNDVMEMFDRLRIQMRNTTGGALVTRAAVLLQPLQ